MSQEINASLKLLEGELDRLKSAVDHIDKAKMAAQKVVTAVDSIHRRYIDQFDSLHDQQKNMLRTMGDTATEKLGTVSEKAAAEVRTLGTDSRKQVLEAGSRVRKYLEEYDSRIAELIRTLGVSASEQVDKTGSVAGKYIQDAGRRLQTNVDELVAKAGGQIDRIGSDVDEQVKKLGSETGDQLEKIGGDAGKHVQDIGSRAVRYLEEVGSRSGKIVEQLGDKSSSVVQDFGDRAKTVLEEINARAKNHLENSGSKSLSVYAGIKKANEKMILEIANQSATATDLVASTDRLVKDIEAVDFPKKLEQLDDAASEIQTSIDATQEMMERLDVSLREAVVKSQTEIMERVSRLENWAEKANRQQEENFTKKHEQMMKALSMQRLFIILITLLTMVIGGMLYTVHFKDDAAGGTITVPETDSLQTEADQ